MKSSFCAALLLSAMALPAWAAPVAEVTAVRGDAKSGSHALAVGDPLEIGAEVRTGTDGRVRLRFIDGSTLVVGDRTVMKVERFDMAAGDGNLREAATLLLNAGLIGQKVAPSKGGSWEVRTPTAVTAVRGTEFVVEIEADQATAVNVQSGKVEVEAVQGTRSLRPRSRVTLADPQAGTQCNPSRGCSPSAAWEPERVKSTQARLSLD